MKITFDHLQENNTQAVRAGGEQTGVKAAKAAESGASVSGILFGKGQEQQAYGKQTKSAQEVKDQAGLLDGADYKNYMAVMASSMSGEDFSALVEDGVKPGKTEVGDMVTIMDYIKTVMAKAGIVIEGFNGGGDIPMEKLEEMTGNAAYAQSMANAFAENDVPLTQENVTEAMKQSDLAMDITGLSDSVKQYLIENGSELTIDQIYMAKYSAQTKGAGAVKGAYFADDLNGYYGKTTEHTDVGVLSAQIEKVIQEAGLEVSAQTKAEASWLLEKGMLLTGDNLEKLHRMNEMEFPMTREDALSHIAQALREGKQAKEADLSQDGIYKQAEKIKEAVDAISPQAVEQVVAAGEPLNIRNLSGAQRSIDAAMSVQVSVQMQSGGAEISVHMEANLVHAQRTLEEVRLQMTISANVMLLKSDYAIDTAELSELVEELKAAEQKMAQTQGLSLPKQEDHALFLDTMAKTSAIRQMPIAVLGRIVDISDRFTLSHVYEEGRILEATYKKAGESYEALMTAPRADLGDRISDAFSNVDDILKDLGFELTQDNRKAVRALAYNQMELTEEHITAVRSADAQLKYLLDKMTPSATLSMIREGIHPLEKSVQELTDYFMQQNNELTEAAESFSKFLYQMEQNDQITAEERDSYIGIYRLIRQIEKGDGKAIGTIVANGQELTFANLLSAVRTGQKKGISVTVDDDFGLLEKTENKGTRISDQINRYYETKAAELLEQMNPFVMAQGQVTMETTWDALMEMSPSGDAQQSESAYRQEQLADLRNQLQAGGEAAEYLLSNGQPVTPDNLGAAEKFLKNRGEMFRGLTEMFADEEELLAELDQVKEHFTDEQAAQEAYEQMQGKVSEHLEETMYTGQKGYLDIRAIAALSKQLSLAGNLAKEENYELPAVIDGQLTSVNVRFRKEAQGEAKNSVSVYAVLAGGEKITAELKVQGDTITGYMGCDSREKTAQLTAKKEDFIQNILSETGKTADINFVYSKEVKTYETLREAGKPLRSVNDLQREDKSEEVQGRQASAKELYQTAKAFIAMLEDPA